MPYLPFAIFHKKKDYIIKLWDLQTHEFTNKQFEHQMNNPAIQQDKVTDV